ncbi:stress response protein NST1 isoform X2 [Lucilia sericata]|uniref:stress response protein NST1 isoform X2 n=1 Tax=Lucilia sericata TaxID=13632 RepID=UPI0018A81D92|nr:stress response protein NST1 isoform X2 [Lucilia sericata]
MMRQRQRKTIEELYGGKFDAPKSIVTTATQPNNAQKTGRVTERDCGYIISSNTHYNGPPPTPTLGGNTAAIKSLNSGKETFRRKSARHSNKLTNEKHCVKDIILMDEGKVGSPMQTMKEVPATADNVPQHHQHHHHQHHNHHHNVHDEDKDDDTDEFFELIRRTVESAIGKSISELLNRNFKELCSKVERFSAELKNTNALLSQMQNELSNKIIHYGEENSRHFRYLCMKSEYDKMFYQHQTMISAATTTTTAPKITENKKPEKRKSAPKLSSSTPKMQRNESESKATTSCPCSSRKCKKSPSREMKDPNKTSSEDISRKSSEVGMREVLEHIQKFCTQMQFNDFKCEQSSEGGMSQNRNIMRPDELIEINKDIFVDDEADEEEDEWEISSDGMTPRNRENDTHKYGSTTARGSVTQRGNNGAGDG